MHLNIKICFNKDNLGGSEPTQYSQCFVSSSSLLSLTKGRFVLINLFFLFSHFCVINYQILKTKTVQVTAFETAQEIVNRCMHLFNLETNTPSSLSSAAANSAALPSASQSQIASNMNQQPMSNSVYQLWLKTNQNEPLIPLIGK